MAVIGYCIECGAEFEYYVGDYCYCDNCRSAANERDRYLMRNARDEELDGLRAAILGQLAKDHRLAIRRWKRANTDISKRHAWDDLKYYHRIWRSSWVDFLLGELHGNQIISAIERGYYGLDSPFAKGDKNRHVYITYN